MKTLRLGIIGGGLMGREMASAIGRWCALTDAPVQLELTAICDLADRYDYDSSIEDLTVDGGVGDDEFSLDDNASDTRVIGGPGADVVQVGQLYGAAACEPAWRGRRRPRFHRAAGPAGDLHPGD